MNELPFRKFMGWGFGERYLYGGHWVEVRNATNPGLRTVDYWTHLGFGIWRRNCWIQKIYAQWSMCIGLSFDVRRDYSEGGYGGWIATIVIPFTRILFSFGRNL